MMRRSLLGLLALLLFAEPSYATVTCTAGDFVNNTASASTTLTVTITIPVQTYRRPVININDYSDETTTISSVSSSDGGSWTVLGPDDMSTGATGRQWFAYQSTLGGTGSSTITVTFSGSINSSGVAGTCYSDTASLNYTSSAAYAEYTTSSSWTSNSRTSTTTGVVISDMISTSGNCDISSVGTNQTEMTSPTGSRRTQIITRPEASAGTYDTTATLAFNCTGQIGAHLFEEAAAAASTRSRMLLGVGQ